MPGIRQVSFTSPYADEEAEILRRQKMAEMLQAQGQEPLGPTEMVSNWAIPTSPLKGLAKMAKSAMGGYQASKSKELAKRLMERQQADRSSDMSALVRAMQGSPGGLEADAADNVTQMPARPAGQIDPATLAGIKTPEMQSAAMQMWLQQMKPKEPYTLTPGAVRFGQDGKQIASAPFAPKETPKSNLSQLMAERDALPQGDPRRAAYENAIRKASETAKQISPTIINQREPSAPVAVVTKDGKGVELVSRQDAIGRIPANMDAATQGNLAGAKLSAREQAQREASYPEATKQVNTIVENTEALTSQLKALKTHKGLSGITGAVFGRTPSVSNESMAAQAIYDNVVNNVFVTALQSMRAASKTGGAVGNVSDKEGERLEQTLAALSRAQGTKDFQNQIDIAVSRLELAKKNIKEAYDHTFEYRSKQSGVSAVDALLDKYK